MRITLLRQKLLRFFTYVGATFTDIYDILLEANCTIKLLVEIFKKLLKHLCSSSGEYVGVYIFTMETFLMLGLNQFFINVILKQLYPDRIGNRFNNFKICNIGQHWIRVAVEGSDIVIYDSDVLRSKSIKALTDKKYNFASCP